MPIIGRITSVLLAASAFAGMSLQNASAETRTFVVSWFSQATYSKDGDCPDGENSFDALMSSYRRELQGRNFTPKELDDYIEHADVERNRRPEVADERGRVDGRTVNSYANPEAPLLDGSNFSPRLHTLQSHFAFGFNLDGKGEASPTEFEDPETHEKGVNNELYRVMGCITSYRAMPPVRSYSGWGYQWQQVRDSMPAWLISIDGADLGKDGLATVTFDRALERADIDARGEVRNLATFRIDPTPRSHNVFHGQMKNGVLTVEPIDFHMLGDPYLVPEFRLRQAHMRMTLKPDGSLDAIMGGYTPWLPIYWAVAAGGRFLELPLAIDMIAYYRTLKQFSDADPDPRTGRNTTISAAFHLEAVPAFTVPADADQDAQAPSNALLGQVP